MEAAVQDFALLHPATWTSTDLGNVYKAGIIPSHIPTFFIRWRLKASCQHIIENRPAFNSMNSYFEVWVSIVNRIQYVSAACRNSEWYCIFVCMASPTPTPFASVLYNLIKRNVWLLSGSRRDKAKNSIRKLKKGQLNLYYIEYMCNW